jgi:glycogen operon protein
VRRFVKGDDNVVPALANRIVGSPDLYEHEQREAEQSINFVACHDGFTLNDVVSYNEKHNEANGEANHDGANDNASWNCGAEGPTDDPKIEELRNRQVKNFLAVTLLSAGAPMLLMGDEVRRTQQGNNNAYCLDTETNWFDWDLVKEHADIHRFVKALLGFRKRRDVLARHGELTLTELLNQSRLKWHGVEQNRPDWGGRSHSLAFTVRTLSGRFLLHGIFNAYWEPLKFELPVREGRERWRRCLDTALPSPDDITSWDKGMLIDDTSYVAQPRSVVMLAMSVGAGSKDPASIAP